MIGCFDFTLEQRISFIEKKYPRAIEGRNSRVKTLFDKIRNAPELPVLSITKKASKIPVRQMLKKFENYAVNAAKFEIDTSKPGFFNNIMQAPTLVLVSAVISLSKMLKHEAISLQSLLGWLKVSYPLLKNDQQAMRLFEEMASWSLENEKELIALESEQIIDEFFDLGSLSSSSDESDKGKDGHRISKDSSDNDNTSSDEGAKREESLNDLEGWVMLDANGKNSDDRGSGGPKGGQGS